MAYEVQVNDTAGIVELRMWESPSLEEHEAARHDALRACRKSGSVRLLVDLTGVQRESVLSTGDCYDFGASFEHLDFPPGFRLAVVLAAQSPSRDDLFFITIVGKNRGTPMTVFDDIDEAWTWLGRDA